LFSNFNQNDDLIFSKIFFGFSLTLVDQISKTNVISESILNKSNYKNNFFDNFFKEICRIILETRNICVGFSLVIISKFI